MPFLTFNISSVPFSERKTLVFDKVNVTKKKFFFSFFFYFSVGGGGVHSTELEKKILRPEVKGIHYQLNLYRRCHLVPCRLKSCGKEYQPWICQSLTLSALRWKPEARAETPDAVLLGNEAVKRRNPPEPRKQSLV